MKIIKTKFYTALYHAGIIYDLAQQKYKKFMWQSEITPAITLGAIPLNANKAHPQAIMDVFDGGCVISLLQPFEYHKTGDSIVPITKQQWDDIGICFHNFPTYDGQAVDTDDLNAIHIILSKNKEAGIKTYIHCRQGHGRSAMCVIYHLSKETDLNSALKFVTEKRSAVVLKPCQLERLKELSNACVD